MEHHLNVVHRRNGRITKGGKMQYDASGLLGFNDEEDEKGEEEDPLEFIAQGLNTDMSKIIEMVEYMQQTGQPIPTEVVQVIQAHRWKEDQAKTKRMGFQVPVSNDNEGIDFTRIVNTDYLSSLKQMVSRLN